ncbi:MAG: Ig-like domain-containing protein, partial [Nonlabens sp.]
GGQVRLVLRDADGNPLGGVAVRLTLAGGDATLASANGTTDASGSFTSLLFSKVQTVATVKALVDTDGDGMVDAELAQTSVVAFIEDLAMTNGVGINIETPDDSAVLHINANDRGVMIPRVALQGCSDRVTILDPATSLLVFNTNASDSLRVGYAYFNGTDWVNFLFD